MTDEQRREEAQKVADFRYGLIAEFANPYLSREERRRLLAEKARLEYEVPRRGRRKLTAGCLRNWLRLYLKYGKEGLLPQPRRDAGTPRSLSPEEGALLLSHLEQHPELSASVALKVLQKEGKIRGCPSSSSLSRLVRAAGMQRPNRLRDKQREETHKFDFSAPLECVQVDGLYTVVVPDAKARKRQAVLMSFLDDATRRVVYGTFGFSENSVAFEQGIKHILKAHGKIGRVYVDHGSAFVSGQSQRILDTLGIILVHSRVGVPRGRGKIVMRTHGDLPGPLQVGKILFAEPHALLDGDLGGRQRAAEPHDLPEMRSREVGVEVYGDRTVSVAKNLGDRLEVCPSFDGEGGEGVSKRVGTRRRAQLGLPQVGLEEFLNASGLKGSIRFGTHEEIVVRDRE